MHKGSVVKTSRLSYPNSRLAWLLVVMGMLVLNVTIVALDDSHQSLVFSGILDKHQANGCPTGLRETFLATFNTDDAGDEPPGVRPLFLYPVETEPSDLEPLTPKHKKLSVHSAVHPALIRNAATGLIGAAVPLYLTYQSLIC